MSIASIIYDDERMLINKCCYITFIAIECYVDPILYSEVLSSSFPIANDSQVLSPVVVLLQ